MKTTTKPNIKPGYKKTPIGIIPKDWEVKKIKDLSSRIGDGIHSTPEYTPDKEYYFINGNNLKNGKIVVDENTKTVTEEESLKHKRELNNRTILMSINGTIGNLAFYTNEKVMLGKSACYLNVLDQVSLNYVYYQLGSRFVQTSFLKRLTGSTIKNLGLNEIRKTKLPIPPLQEQKSIANCLSTWDSGIEKLTQLIQAKKQQKKGLMQQLLTGKKRLAGFGGEWKEVNLEKIVSIKKGNTITSSTAIDGDFKVIAGGKTSPYNHNEWNYENVVTVSASGAYAGYVQYVEEKIWASDCSVIEPKKNKADIKYIYALLKLRQGKIYLQQSGGAQPHVYPQDLKKMSFMVPPIEEQTAIANILQTADKEIELLEQKLSSFQQQKKGLMQVLLTGERRLV